MKLSTQENINIREDREDKHKSWFNIVEDFNIRVSIREVEAFNIRERSLYCMGWLINYE